MMIETLNKLEDWNPQTKIDEGIPKSRVCRSEKNSVETFRNYCSQF